LTALLSQGFEKGQQFFSTTDAKASIWPHNFQTSLRKIHLSMATPETLD